MNVTFELANLKVMILSYHYKQQYLVNQRLKKQFLIRNVDFYIGSMKNKQTKPDTAKKCLHYVCNLFFE